MVRAVLLLIVAASIGVSAQTRDTRTWYQAYRDAQTKIQQRNWQGALNDLDAAARAGAPRPARNTNFYGDVYDTYNPDYYRGVALLNLQRYDEADQAFERVRTAQLINAREPLYAQFVRFAQDVKDNMAKLAAASAQPAPPVTTGTAPPVDRPPVTAAQADPGAGVPNPAAPPPVNNTPNAGVAGTQQTGIASAPPAAPANVAPGTSKAPLPPARPTARPQVTADVGVIPPRATPAAEERAAMLAFFSGDYATAAGRLSGLVGSGVARPRTYLYLACSQVALEMTGRSLANAESPQAVVARIGDIGALSRDLQLISPRIRQQLGLPQ